MPNSFLPNEDQGYVIANVQLPPGATAERTGTVMRAMEEFVMKQPETANIVAITGFSFSGQGQNMGLAFIPMKAWDERNKDVTQIIQEYTERTSHIKGADIQFFAPPPVPGPSQQRRARHGARGPGRCRLGRGGSGRGGHG